VHNVKSTCGAEQSARGYSLIELLFIVGFVATITAIAVPMMGNTFGSFRLIGDARGIRNEISLARMQAAANFTRARLYVDLATRSYHTETWQSTGVPAWIAQDGARYLSSAVEQFSYGPVAAPPLNTQATIGQAPPCRDAAGAVIMNTACIVFNSRGIPVDSSGAPTAVNALYVSDGTAVYGTTVSATSIVRLWRANPSAGATWVLQ